MKNYVILRHAKLKTMGNIASSLQHCFREIDTPNADKDLEMNNVHYYEDNTLSSIA